MLLDDKIQDFIKENSIFQQKVDKIRFNIFTYLNDIGNWDNKQYIVVKENYDNKFKIYKAVSDINFDLILPNETIADEVVLKMRFEKDQTSILGKIKEITIFLKDLTKNFFVFNTEDEAILFLESKNL